MMIPPAVLPVVDDTIEKENEEVVEVVEDEEDEEDAILWDGGPPIPPDPDKVINDLSCQGTVAMALQEALVELRQDETMKSLEEKYNFQFDSDEVMRTFGESVVQQQHCQYDAQFDDAMKQQRDLLQQQQRKSKYAANHRTKSGTISEEIDSISTVAPAAMLRGRMNHYNRYGTKWRIVVDDVEIIPRRPVEAQQLRQMKRDRTMSLWSVMSQPSLLNATDELPQQLPIKIPRLEILVYNDIE